jgi:hypothetical protein
MRHKEQSMRHLTRHQEAGSQGNLIIEVEDQTATDDHSFTSYVVSGFDASGHPAANSGEPEDVIARITHLLKVGENGPSGQRGITVESLMAICCDRLSTPQGAEQYQHPHAMLENLNAAMLMRHSLTHRQSGAG